MRTSSRNARIIRSCNSRSFRLPAATVLALSVLAAARAQGPAAQEAVQAPLLVVRIADEQDKPIAGAELYLVQNDNIPLSRTWVAAVDGRAEIKAIDVIGDPRKPFTGKVAPPPGKGNP